MNSSAWRSVVLAVSVVLLPACGADGQDVAVTSSGVDRQAEWEQILAAGEQRDNCMADLGYVVDEDEDGDTTIQPMAGDEGDQQFFADLEVCIEQHPLPPVAP